MDTAAICATCCETQEDSLQNILCTESWLWERSESRVGVVKQSIARKFLTVMVVTKKLKIFYFYTSNMLTMLHLFVLYKVFQVPKILLFYLNESVTLYCLNSSS
jgi:hypothetical protein